jgi:hypothetical protein
MREAAQKAGDEMTYPRGMRMEMRMKEIHLQEEQNFRAVGYRFQS